MDNLEQKISEAHSTRAALTAEALNAHSWISRYAENPEIYKSGILGPLEQFIDIMGALAGIDFPLIDPATRSEVYSSDGKPVLQRSHRLGMSSEAISDLLS